MDVTEPNSTTAHESFELLEEIGRGEVTVVHRAYDLNLGRDVAIKHLNQSCATNKKLLDGFLAQARFLAQFDHPAILRIHSVEPSHGWVVMDLMKGSLQSRIQQGPVEPNTVHSILCQLLPALEFLHDQGKVHASIRPSNILIDEEGRVKLSDFEANNYDGELRAPTGTKKYLAPELVRTDVSDVGPATDLYCLGFTALEMLAGPRFSERVLSGLSENVDADIAWLRWHGNEMAFPPADQLAKKVPADLAAVIDSLVNKDISQRPSSAGDALAQLGQHPIVPVAIPEDANDRLATQDQTQASMLPA
ncbi:MAG TPA: hypothetical protein DDW52_00095, partial [Planctomycetaceae bacterium]|nr:hypothetical protein [Planctomycetaceae bacterium]